MYRARVWQMAEPKSTAFEQADPSSAAEASAPAVRGLAQTAGKRNGAKRSLTMMRGRTTAQVILVIRTTLKLWNRASVGAHDAPPTSRIRDVGRRSTRRVGDRGSASMSAMQRSLRRARRRRGRGHDVGRRRRRRGSQDVVAAVRVPKAAGAAGPHAAGRRRFAPRSSSLRRWIVSRAPRRRVT